MKRHKFLGRKQGRQERALNKLVATIQAEERDGDNSPKLAEHKTMVKRLRFGLFGLSANVSRMEIEA